MLITLAARRCRALQAHRFRTATDLRFALSELRPFASVVGPEPGDVFLVLTLPALPAHLVRALVAAGDLLLGRPPCCVAPFGRLSRGLPLALVAHRAT